MPETPPSKTSNYQRLKEMMCHLTPQNAVIPYNICFDVNGHFWVASKGGLFKFDSIGTKLLFALKNDFPKKIAPYMQVLHFNSKIIYVCTDDKAALTEFKTLALDGTIEHEHFVEGKIQSLAVNKDGELFMTKQPTIGSNESTIWKSHIDLPLAWEEFCSTFYECFQAICVFGKSRFITQFFVIDDDTLAVSVASLPVNLYSKQSIKWVNTKNAQILGSFAMSGKNDGQIYFPRCLRRHKDSLLVMDKTGRIQRFSGAGKFENVSAKIDDFIGNGFTIRDDEAIIVCSGIVQDINGRTICDDWVEGIRLDGSRWT